jgi:Uma2 family endonuclease
VQAVIREMPKHWLEERRKSEASCRDEMWSGVLHMAPMPNLFHQEFVGLFEELLRARWARPNGGKVYHEVNLTTPEDEADWTNNYRVPDIVLLSADRLQYRRGDYIAGPPLVCVEIHSPNDEAYEKLPFYAGLGVPEVWIIHRDTKKPEVFALESGEYKTRSADADGWTRSDAVGLRMKDVDGKLWVLFEGDGEHVALPD